MIKQFQFLRAIDTKKVLNDVFKNIFIQNGLLQVSNGKLTITATNCELLQDISVNVDADRFLKAMLLAGDNAVLSKTDKSLIVKHAKKGLRVRLGIEEQNSFPHSVLPHAKDLFECHNLLETLRMLEPFIGEAGKTALWSCGVLIKNQHAYATNNVVVIRHEHTIRNFNKAFILPKFTIDTLLKIDEEPQALFADNKHVWFLYDNNCWLQSVLVNASWPETIDDMINSCHDNVVATIKNSDIIHEDIKALTPFCEDSSTQTIIMQNDKISTKEGTVLAELQGDAYALGDAAFRARPLIEVLKIATHADFSSTRVPFSGQRFQGILMGVRS